MSQTIEIVDRGRGPQLSTTRITVLDLVPYFRAGCSHEEIIRWVPTLTSQEICVVERYYLEHLDEFVQKDRRVREYREEQIRLQRLRFPEPEEDNQKHFDRLKKMLQERCQEKNGEGHPG